MVRIAHRYNARIEAYSLVVDSLSLVEALDLNVLLKIDSFFLLWITLFQNVS